MPPSQAGSMAISSTVGHPIRWDRLQPVVSLKVIKELLATPEGQALACLRRAKARPSENMLRHCLVNNHKADPPKYEGCAASEHFLSDLHGGVLAGLKPCSYWFAGSLFCWFGREAGGRD